MLRFIMVACFAILLISCKETKPIDENTIFHESVKSITDVMVHDIFSPPVASRIYAYSSIAAYEAARFVDSSYLSLGGQISHLPNCPKPESGKKYSFTLAATLAYLKVGKKFIFSEDTIQAQIEKVSQLYQNSGMDSDVFERSVAFSDSMSTHIIKWASKDNYSQTRSYPKFSLTNDPGTWKPTPPAYMDGIEPSWNVIRTLVMDSAAQFKPAPPTPFNMKDKNSQYYKEVMETYMAVKEVSEENNEIANFWDCNPFKLNVTGHIMHATKKISPGGHWINISALASEKTKSSFIQSAHTYAMVSIGLFEAFISCWDEKYRSKAIRPETVINEYIDPEWMPVLQTPPFPEYTSGHSVASGAAALILTNIYGDNFAFEDVTEAEFGLPSRNFTSFIQASEEAAVSRLYGGIHYRPAIENGLTQGQSVGKLVIEKIKFK